MQAVRRLAMIALPVAALAACSESTVDPTATEVTPQFAKTAYNLKFAWTGLELDGDGKSNDVMEAHVRSGGGGANTTCVYFADNRSYEIGRYYAETWGSTDDATVKQFCLSHVGDAVTGGGQRFNYQVYFNDVALDGSTTGDISAHSKQSNHGPYSSCVYYSQDGATYLGNYGGAVAFVLKSDLLNWCVSHFADKTDT